MTLVARGAAVGVVVGLAVSLAGCWTVPPPPREPVPEPSITGPFPPAPLDTLVPAQAVTSDEAGFESHPAVQTARITDAVLAWANLVDGIEFGQFTRYIDPGWEPNVIVLNERNSWRLAVPIGPTPFEVRSVTENPDGSTTVQVCEGVWPQVFKEDGAPVQASAPEYGSVMDFTVSPLTEQEVAQLTLWGMQSPALRVRDYRPAAGRCEPELMVVQEFANWRAVAPIGRYSGHRAGPMDVVVPGEDEPRPREDMP